MIDAIMLTLLNLEIHSTQNGFELHWTFCPAYHGSLAGHFGILLNMSEIYSKKESLCRHFLLCFSSQDSLLHFLLLDILLGENLPLRRTFEIPPADLRTLNQNYIRILLASHVISFYGVLKILRFILLYYFFSLILFTCYLFLLVCSLA